MPRLARENLLRAINKYHPKSLTALRSILRSENLEFEDEELLRLLRQLRSEGKLELVEPAKPVSLGAAFGSVARSWWLYSVLLVAGLEYVLVVYNSQSIVLVSFRAVFGVLLLGFVPGYSAVKAVFPDTSFPFLERVLLSIFLSVVISIGLGTLLGAFLLFTGQSSTLLISFSTILLGLVGAFRSALRTSVSNPPIVKGS